MAYIRRRDDTDQGPLSFLGNLLGIGARGVGRRPFRDMAPDMSSQPFFGFPGGRLGWTQWRDAGAPASFDPGFSPPTVSPLESGSSVRSEPGYSGAPGVPNITPISDPAPSAPGAVQLTPSQVQHWTRTPAPPPPVKSWVDLGGKPILPPPRGR